MVVIISMLIFLFFDTSGKLFLKKIITNSIGLLTLSLEQLGLSQSDCNTQAERYDFELI